MWQENLPDVFNLNVVLWSSFVIVAAILVVINRVSVTNKLRTLTAVRSPDITLCKDESLLKEVIVKPFSSSVAKAPARKLSSKSFIKLSSLSSTKDLLRPKHLNRTLRLLLTIVTLGYMRRGFKRRNSRKRYNKKVTLYRKMPLKAMSRLWGRMNRMNLPHWLRSPTYRLYIWMFGCNLQEAAIEDLYHYKNLGEFFRRPLKANVRPVDDAHCITSPADGKVLHYGRVENGHLEQVKGIHYSLHGFLGPANWQTETEIRNSGEEEKIEPRPLSEEQYECTLKENPDNELYHCVVYLAPGDYHRFHSPAKWNVSYRRHFPGELLSVSPGIARWVQGLFNFNERAVYYGNWQHGFFSMTAVGATNVGSIKVNFDEDLVTNCGRKWKDGTYFDKSLTNNNGRGIAVEKGEEFGEFNLGSTIVLIFEAPKNFDFKIVAGQKIRFGEPLGNHSHENNNKS